MHCTELLHSVDRQTKLLLYLHCVGFCFSCANHDFVKRTLLQQMMSAGIDVRGYTIEPTRILFVCDQPQAVEFEWNNKKTTPADLSTNPDSDADQPTDPMARFTAMQDEQAQLAKRKAKKEKKQREADKKRRKKLAAKKKKQQEEAARKKKSAEEQKKKQQQQEQQQQQPPSDLKTDL
jgi:Skp family chaperone for outer membrane proteins